VVAAVTGMDQWVALEAEQEGQADQILALLELLGKVMLAVVILGVVVLTAHMAALVAAAPVVLADHQDTEIGLVALVRHLQLQGRQLPVLVAVAVELRTPVVVRAARGVLEVVALEEQMAPGQMRQAMDQVVVAMVTAEEIVARDRRA